MVDLTAESKDSEVTVTYKANMESTETKEVQQTIHYLYEDGTEAFTQTRWIQSLHRTVTTNEATEETTYGEWQAKDDDTTLMRWLVQKLSTTLQISQLLKKSLV